MTKTYLHVKTVVAVAFCLMFHILACHAQTRQSVDSLLRCIDKAVDNFPEYVGKRERKINKLRKELARAKTDSERYRVSFSLSEQYTPFVNDSAVYFLDRCVTIASRMKGREADVCTCKALIAMRHSSTGIYVESLKTLSDIDTANVSSLAKGMYFQAYTHVYGEMATTATLPPPRPCTRRYRRDTERGCTPTCRPPTTPCSNTANCKPSTPAIGVRRCASTTAG